MAGSDSDDDPEDEERPTPLHWYRVEVCFQETKGGNPHQVIIDDTFSIPVRNDEEPTRALYNCASLKEWIQDLKVDSDIKEEVFRLLPDERRMTERLYNKITQFSTPNRLRQRLTILTNGSLSGKGMSRFQLRPRETQLIYITWPSD